MSEQMSRLVVIGGGMGSTNHPRLNIELTTPEEVQLFNDFKALAAIHGLSIHEAGILGISEALYQLQKRTLPPNTVVRLSKTRKKPVYEERKAERGLD